ncbi:hypothetical protein FRC06_006498 [Ceratobasidium sp. 370]|nr:hypothetical protein FRC06_006498 [Ceratobasidium sp. 370]
MSILLPRSYSTGSRSGRRDSPGRDSPGQTELELAQEPDLSNPQFRSVEVQVQPEEGAEDVLNAEHENGVEDKQADSETAAQPPLDPEAKYEENLKKAQEEWARRRKAGYEDYGAEMAKDAKVWQVYVNETDRADEELVDGWHKSLDVLLTKVFAALFSAISTAFVSISSQSLQQNPSDTSAQTLLVISQTLLTMSSGGSANSSSSSANQTPSDFKPSHAAVVVNALWFLSLSLSVAVSLIAMLAKEWCHAFMSGRAGETYERARLRQHRWNEIERLKMMDVLTLLPLLMHLALLLFAVGLCIYLWDINISVAIPVVLVTSGFALIYFSTAVHSLVYEHCPYTTASSKLAKSYIKAGFALTTPYPISWARTAISPIKSWVAKAQTRMGPWTMDGTRTKQWAAKYGSYATSWATTSKTFMATWAHKINRTRRSPPDTEGPLVDDPNMDLTTTQMLTWLLKHSSDSKTMGLVIRSLAGAEPWLPRLPLLEHGILGVIFQELSKYFEYDFRRQVYRLSPSASPDMGSLYLRALQFLLGYYNGYGFILYTEPRTVVKNTWSQDFYHRSRTGMAYGIEEDGLDFRVDSFSDSSDVIAFWRSFSLAIASDADPQARYADLGLDAIIMTVEEHLSGDIVLHPTTLVTLVRQIMNRLCLPTRFWESLPNAPHRLCFLLLKLYVYSANHGQHRDLQYSISIAIATAVLNFGTYPGGTHPPDNARLQRAQELVAYHNPPRVITYLGELTTLRAARRVFTDRLMGFGLLGLLELPLAHQMTHDDLETWVSTFNQVHDAYLGEHVHIQSIPPTFTFGTHSARAVARYVDEYLPSSDFRSHPAEWLLAASLSGNQYLAPAAMNQLWNLVDSMLPLVNESPIIKTLLLPLRSVDEPMPKGVGELGLLQQWFPHIQTMCAESPQALTNSGFLVALKVYYYSSDHYQERVVLFSDERDGPEEGEAFRVAHIFEELDMKCNLAIEIEEQNWQDLPFDPSIEGAGSWNE